MDMESAGDEATGRKQEKDTWEDGLRTLDPLSSGLTSYVARMMGGMLITAASMTAFSFYLSQNTDSSIYQRARDMAIIGAACYYAGDRIREHQFRTLVQHR